MSVKDPPTSAHSVIVCEGQSESVQLRAGSEMAETERCIAEAISLMLL